MKPWLAHYDHDVPHSLVPYPNLTLVDYLSKLAREHAGQTALLFKGTTMTYGELQAAINGFAAGALLVMLIDSMIPQATSQAGKVAGLVTVLGFAVAAGLSSVS